MTENGGSRGTKYIPGMPRKTFVLVLILCSGGIFYSIMESYFYLVSAVSESGHPILSCLFGWSIFAAICTVIIRLGVNWSAGCWRKWFISWGVGFVVGLIVASICYFTSRHRIIGDALIQAGFVAVGVWVVMNCFWFFPRRYRSIDAHDCTDFDSRLAGLVLCPTCKTDMSSLEQLVCPNCRRIIRWQN